MATGLSSTGSILSRERPFPGLRPFGYEDHAFFFGRKQQSYALYNLLDLSQFVAVIGSSGSGKSSLVKAGLLPLLDNESAEVLARDEDRLGGRVWRWFELRPGERPISRLADQLAALSAPQRGGEYEEDTRDRDARRERIDYMLRRSSFGLGEALVGIDALADRSLLILVDQFEELFRYAGFGSGQSWDEGAQFVQLLLEASRGANRYVHVMITMRSDFIGDCARFYGLPEAVSAAQFLVPSLTRDQREEAVRGPIAAAGAEIDPRLVERLLNDIGSDADDLPVLQHCLLRLWECATADVAGGGELRLKARLGLDHYDKIGRIGGALSRHADEILKDLKGLDLAVEQAFRALSEVDRDGRATRRAVPFAQLLAETGVGEEELRRVLDRFRADDCSFLTPPSSTVARVEDDTRIDVGHEALLRRWDRISRKEEERVDGDTAPPGWLWAEEDDARKYRWLCGWIQDSATAILPFDQAETRWRWWTSRPRTSAWTMRYGEGYESIEQLLVRSREAARLDQERIAAAERIEQERVEAVQRAERAHLEARAAQARKLSILAGALFILLGLFGLMWWKADQAKEESARNSRLALGEVSETLKIINDAYPNGEISPALTQRTLNVAQETLKQINTKQEDVGVGVKWVELSNSFAQMYLTFKNEAALNAAQAALDRAESLAARHPDDDRVQQQLAASHRRMADAQREQGNVGSARAQANASLEILTGLLRKNGAGLALQVERAESRRILGYLREQEGDRNGALKEFRDNLDDLPADKSAEDGWQHELFVNHAEIGSVLKAQGKLSAAEKEFRDLVNQTMTFHPTWQLELADIRLRLGEVLQAGGNLVEAAEEFQKSLNLMKELSEKSIPVGWQNQIGSTYLALANVLKSQGKTKDAQSAFREHQMITERLAALDIGNTDRQLELAVSHNKSGDRLKAQGDLDGAIEEFREFERIMLQLVNRDRQNTNWQQQLSISHMKIGDVLRAQDEPRRAQTEFEESLRIRRSLVEKDPTNAGWKRNLWASERYIGEVLLKQNRLTEALDHFTECLNLSRALLAADPSTPGEAPNRQSQRDIAIIYNRIGQVYQAKEDFDSASAEFSLAIGVMVELTTKEPSNITWQGELADDYRELATALQRQSHVPDALKNLADDLQIRMRLVDGHPENGQFRLELAETHRLLASAYDAKGDPLAAQEEYQACQTIAVAMAAPTNDDRRLKERADYCQFK